MGWLLLVMAGLWVVTRLGHIGWRESELSEMRQAQLIAQCEREEAAELRRQQVAYEEWKEEKLARGYGRAPRPLLHPHDFSMVSFKVRVVSHAQLEREEQEHKALRFLRGA